MPVMDLGYDRPLYLLAFDHRASFQKKLFGIAGQPTPEEALRIAEAKAVIGDGFFDAVARGASKEAAGLLVDEQFGAEIARRAKREGHVFAMPVEKSGQDEFDFEYGEEFGAHIEAFDPTFAKVLVRFNPEGDPEMNRRQGERLKLLSDWLHGRDRKFLFELLVAAEPEQLEKVGGDVDRFDRELRPGFMVEAIRELQEWAIEPDVWKIEGLDREEDCRRVSEQARSGGRDRVACVVLGRGANEEAVLRWLRTGAAVEGYIGFAVGRTLWWDVLEAWLGGTVERAEASRRIADNYLRMIEAYASAAASRVSPNEEEGGSP
jgi:myo-inositol catabolism protein IolC